MARPLTIVSPAELVGCLRDLVENEGVKEVVVGVPKTLGGEVGFQAKRVLRKLDLLRREFPGVRFVEWDERFTTRLVTGSGSKGGRRKKNREPVDDLAAARMLQEVPVTLGGKLAGRNKKSRREQRDLDERLQALRSSGVFVS